MYGRTALHVACEWSLAVAVDLLLNFSGLLSIEGKDELGWTPLHYCAANDSYDAGK